MAEPGRPPKDAEPRSERLYVRVTPTLKDRLADVVPEGMTSELVNAMLWAYVQTASPGGVDEAAIESAVERTKEAEKQ